jgi:serine/threonine protein kinase
VTGDAFTQGAPERVSDTTVLVKNMPKMGDFFKQIEKVQTSDITEEFEKLDMAGVESFTDVMQDRKTGVKYAVKTLPPKSEGVKMEIRLQERVASEHIVSIYKAFLTETGEYLLMTELLPDGTVNDKIVKGNKAVRGGGLKDGLDVRDTFRQMLDAVKHCHDNDVVHLNIKPALMWLDGNKVELGDFGAAREVKGSTRTPGRMTPTFRARGFLAPELMLKQVDLEFSATAINWKAVDIWCLGVTFYEILTGRVSGADGTVDTRRPLRGGVDNELKDLVESMLQLDPAKRFTIDDVASHAYFEHTEAWTPPTYDKRRFTDLGTGGELEGGEDEAEILYRTGDQEFWDDKGGRDDFVQR